MADSPSAAHEPRHPPLFFYAVGAALVLAGPRGTLTLGRRRPERDIQGDDPDRPPPATGRAGAPAAT